MTRTGRRLKQVENWVASMAEAPPRASKCCRFLVRQYSPLVASVPGVLF